MTDIAIRVQNLSKCYEIYDKPRDRLKQFFVPRLQRMSLKTAVGTYEKPFVLMYRSMNGFSYVQPLGVVPKPVHSSTDQGERTFEPRNRGF